MKKALVLGVMAIFAISMNLSAQNRKTEPKNEEKAKPAATIKTSATTIKTADVTLQEAPKAEAIKNTEHKKVDEKAAEILGKSDAKKTEAKETGKKESKLSTATSGKKDLSKVHNGIKKESSSTGMGSVSTSNNNRTAKNSTVIKKESAASGMGAAANTKEVGKTNVKKAPDAEKAKKESLKPKTIKTAKDNPSTSSTTQPKQR